MNCESTLNRIALILVFLVSVEAFATQIQFRNRDFAAPSTEYNLKIGSLTLDLGYSLALAYDDNTNRATAHGQQEDGTKIANALVIRVDWPLNPKFHIGSTVNVAYVSYISGTGTEGFMLTGVDGNVAGDLGFDMHVGDTGLITVQDTLSRSIDTIDVDRIDNAEKFALWNNTLSMQYQNQLTQHINTALKLSRKDVWSQEKRFEYRDTEAYAYDALVLWVTNTRLSIGPYVRYETTNYLNADAAGIKHNDSEETEVGSTVRYQATARSVVNLTLGYQMFNFDTKNNPAATDEEDGVVAGLNLVTIISDLLSQNIGLTFRKNLGTATSINFSEDLLATYGLNWRFAEKWSLLGQLTWLKTNESGAAGEIGEVFTQTLGMNYLISKKSNVAWGYRRAEKFSDQFNRDYERNELTMQFNYDF